MALIFYLSSLPKIGNYELPYGADKIVHFAEYAVLGFLISLTLKFTGVRRYILLGVMIATLYGISDEIHQSFVPMRDASIYDVVADSIGSFVGAYSFKQLNFTVI